MKRYRLKWVPCSADRWWLVWVEVSEKSTPGAQIEVGGLVHPRRGAMTRLGAILRVLVATPDCDAPTHAAAVGLSCPHPSGAAAL